ncbi:MAG TPA: HAD family hydrolase [Pontiella sp.]
MENYVTMNPLEDIILKNSHPLTPLKTDAVARLNKLKNIKAVIFDVYGTLIISGSGDVGTATAINTANAFTQALESSGFSGSLEEAGEVGKNLLKSEILRCHEQALVTGNDFPEVEIITIWTTVFEKLQRQNLLKTEPIDRDQIKQFALEYECRANPVYPMPESLNLLRTLKERGLILGIVSNAQFYTPLLISALFENTVEQLGFDLECCIWSYKETKAKPSEDLFPKAAKNLKEKYGIKLSESIYVGNDMLNDIYTANKAGCKTVLFAGDRRSLRLRENDERCTNLKPDAVITSLAQLTEIL